jgi:hypothetical protein
MNTATALTTVKNTFTTFDGKTVTLVVEPKGDKFRVSARDEGGYHLRFMFGVKYDTRAQADAAINDYCA